MTGTLKAASTVAAVTIILTGCGSGVTPANPTPAQRTVSTPSVLPTATADAGGAAPAGSPGSPSASDADTATLRTYGLVNGPSDFHLPAGLVVIESVDQPNVVTLVLPPDDGPTTAAWLARHLPAQGYTVVAASTDSVVFTGPQWSGSFTSDAQLCGFTLRRNS